MSDRRSHSLPIGIPADHPSLPGHFPGRPIVPGVVLLDCVIASAERWLQRPLSLRALPQAKFVAPLLPANGPVLRALALPPVLAITNAAELGIPVALPRVEQALTHGVRLVMVREKQMAQAQLQAFASEVVALCRRFGARTVVNSDAHVAQASAADGLHLPSALLMTARARPPLPLCGASCHHREDRARVRG